MKMKTEMIYVKSVAPHFHEDELEVIVVLKGSIEISKVNRKEIVEEGQLTTINRNITHSIKSSGAYILSARIKLKEFRYIYDRIEYVQFYRLRESIDPNVRYRLNGIVIDCLVKNFLNQKEKFSDEEMSLNEDQLMSTLYSFFRLNTYKKASGEYISDELLDRYYYVVEYVAKHIHEKIVVDDILQHLYMNSTYFSQFMKKVGGYGFKEYVSYEKLVIMVKYLITDRYTMNEIAAKVGIQDMKSFYNSFKKYFQCSPAVWKKEALLIEDDMIVCYDDYIIQDYIRKFHLEKHQTNTITKVYQKLLRLQKESIDLENIMINVQPYDDMDGTSYRFYQVYKNCGLLIRKAADLHSSVNFIYDIKHLMLHDQVTLLYAIFEETMTVYSPSEIRKQKITILVYHEEDIEKAKKVKDELLKVCKYLNIYIEMS